MSKRALIAAYFVLLFALHQDSWWRGDATLVLGVLPVSVAYHVGWTLFVAVGWWLVGRFCWPRNLAAEDAKPPAPPPSPAKPLPR